MREPGKLRTVVLEAATLGDVIRVGTMRLAVSPDQSVCRTQENTISPEEARILADLLRASASNQEGRREIPDAYR